MNRTCGAHLYDSFGLFTEMFLTYGSYWQERRVLFFAERILIFYLTHLRNVAL